LIALPTTSSSGCQLAVEPNFAGLEPRHVEQVVHQAFIRTASSRIAAANSSCTPLNPGFVSASDSARPSSAVSGVRRSCDSGSDGIAQAFGLHFHKWSCATSM